MKGKLVSIGIDVSKSKLDICCISGLNVQDKLRETRIANTRFSILKFLKSLNDMHVPIVLESTADYHVLFSILAVKLGFNVYVINPLITKQFLKADIRKRKTDPIDAFNLARVGILQISSLQKFEDSIQDIMLKRKVNLLGTLQSKLQSLKASLNSFRRISSTLDYSDLDSFNNIQDSYKNFARSTRLLEKDIVKALRSSSDAERISQIQGVSEATASKILAAIKGRSFSNKYKLTAFAGLDISVRQSGTSVHGKGKVTKRGNKFLRNTLFQAAWGLKMHNPEFQKLYEYHKAQGKHYYTCLIILARKLLHVIYGMLKYQSNFNPDLLMIPQI